MEVTGVFGVTLSKPQETALHRIQRDLYVEVRFI